LPSEGDYSRLLSAPRAKSKLLRGCNYGLTPPVPESCIWLKPVILLPSEAKPPCSSPPFVSATAFAIENGKLAPAKTCPPLMVPIRGSTKLRILVAFCALEGTILEVSTAKQAEET
jgi:hypothetical protein